MILIHGWACRAADWRPIAAALPQATWAVDLPGHGDSPAGTHPWTVDAYGATLTEWIAAHGLDQVVLVGHSMGAAVALETATRCTAVTGVVALDALTYAGIYPAQTEKAVDGALAGLREDFGGGVRALVAALFPHDRQSSWIDVIATEMAAIEPIRGIELLADLLRWDMAAVASRVSVPVDIIAASALLTEEGRAAAEAFAKVHVTELGGHFFLRENPAGTASAIAAVIRGAGR
jgi:pimeloyl-ACP methyl ester carboxylesterase